MGKCEGPLNKTGLVIFGCKPRNPQLEAQAGGAAEHFRVLHPLKTSSQPPTEVYTEWRGYDHHVDLGQLLTFCQTMIKEQVKMVNMVQGENGSILKM